MTANMLFSFLRVCKQLPCQATPAASSSYQVRILRSLHIMSSINNCPVLSVCSSGLGLPLVVFLPEQTIE